MDDPKVKFEVVFGAAHAAAAVVTDADQKIVVRTEHLVENNQIEVHNETLTVREWKNRNALAPFDVEAFMGTFTWKKTIERWSWIPEALRDILNLVESAAECLKEDALARVYKEATEAVATFHAALDPLIAATLVHESDAPSPEVMDAVREYLKRKTFLEKRGVIKEQYAGYQRREKIPSRPRRTLRSCDHIFFADGCLNCIARKPEKLCQHALFMINCDDCKTWGAEWLSDDYKDDDESSDDDDDPLHPYNLPDTDGEGEGGEKKRRAPQQKSG